MNEPLNFVGYIYCIRNNVNKKEYIGQTIRKIKYRFTNHKSDYRTGKRSCELLCRAFDKYGVDNFIVYEIERVVCNSKKELQTQLNIKKSHHIKNNCTYVPNGYNLTMGGNASLERQCKKIVQSDEYGNVLQIFDSIGDASRYNNVDRNKIMRSANGAKSKINGLFFSYLDDVKITNYKITNWNRTNRYVVQYNKDGSLIKAFSSVALASANTNINKKSIISCCLGNIPSAGGFRWIYVEGKINIPLSIEIARNHPLEKAVIQFDIDGNEVNRFCSIKKAAGVIGCSESGIIACCKNIQKTCYGHVWKYLSEVS